MSSTIIKDAIDRALSPDQLRSIHSGLATHREEARMVLLTKHVFMRDVNATNHAKKAMELNITAIESAIVLGFYNNYLLDNGLLDWSSYTSDIMKATTHASLSTPLPDPLGSSFPDPGKLLPKPAFQTLGSDFPILLPKPWEAASQTLGSKFGKRTDGVLT